MLSTSRQKLPQLERDYTALSEILYVCRERRVLVVGLTVALVLGVVAVSLFQEPVYTAEAVVYVSLQEDPGTTFDPQSFFSNVVGAVTGGGLMREVMKKAGWKAGVEGFRQRLDVKPVISQGGESSLEVRFSGSSAGQAARSANSYAYLFVERVGKLGQNRLAGGTLNADARVERRAVPPVRKSSPRILLRTAVALFSGLLLGMGGALFLESRARGWRGVRDAEMTLKVPVLGAIPEYDAAGEEV